MADVKDPVEVLCLELRHGIKKAGSMPTDAEVQLALDELDRRARVERRLEKWLRAGTPELPRACHHQFDEDAWGRFVQTIALQVNAEDAAIKTAPDYWTAADAALTAAGAPKESE